MAMNVVYVVFIIHSSHKPADQSENHYSETQQRATLISNSLGEKKKEIQRWKTTPASSSVSDWVNSIKLLHHAKIAICERRVSHRTRKDPVVNSTEEEAGTSIDELVVATDL